MNERQEKYRHVSHVRLRTLDDHRGGKRNAAADALLDEASIPHRRFGPQADQVHHATETDSTALLLWLSAILFFCRAAWWQFASTIAV
jgi:hypothetical protein